MPFNMWGDFVPYNPSGCKYCEYDKSNHCSRWSGGGIGWHSYTEPTKEQRYARIRENARDRKAVVRRKQVDS